MIRRALSALVIAASALFPVLSSAPALADTNGTCIYQTTVTTPSTSIPSLPLCNATRQLISGSQFVGAANTVGQPCWGIVATTGALIPSQRVSVALTASTPVQIVALTASKVIHICGLEFTTVFTVGAAVAFENGTGATCASGTNVFANYDMGTPFDNLQLGNGAQDLYAIPSGNAFCVSPGAFTGTAHVNIDYAVY
jgi:hypothetical protein